MDPAWVSALVVLISAVAGVVLWTFRQVWRFLRRVMRFLDDFFGEPEHDGQAARPGVMARLSQVETMASKIMMEVQPNTGHSLRDAINRQSLDLGQLKGDMADVIHKVETMTGSETK